MVKTKHLDGSQDIMTTKLRITMLDKQSQPENSKTKDSAIKSDPESQSSPSPTTTTTPRLVTKRKATKDVPVTSIPSSPIITSSSATTPQPEPISKRKGGNKRKFTHEYCLTCTRYGRACGGRRDNEDGCAVCRDPDRSKGEKLRECLWADPENGIFDYKVARELFKKAQAEARAQRARPSVKRQRSDAALAHATAAHRHSSLSDTSHLAGPLPQTSKPLNLLPPTLQESAHVSQPDKITQPQRINPPTTTNSSQSVTHPSEADTSPDRAPRIHRPQLSYVRVGSENGEYTVSTSQGPPLVLPPQSRHNGSAGAGPYYWDPNSNSWQQVQIQSASQRIPVYYAHTYRSAYDAPPAPSPQYFMPPPPSGSLSARYPSSPAGSLDRPEIPPRKWSASGRKIISIDGAEWKARAWTSTNDTSKGANSENPTSQEESARKPNDGISDTSSLSTCLSMDRELAADDTASTAVARNGTKLRLHLGSHAGQSDSKKPNTFTFPGQITIQDDEEENASSSDDAELSSDESKHKTLPAKLRKVLSRSRVTKVIIEGDVFEIRPRSMIPSAKIQKKPSVTGGAIRIGSRGKSHRRDQRREPQMPSAETEDEADKESHDDVLADQSEVRDAQQQPAPIKIKLIFNRKAAVRTPEEAHVDDKSGANAQVVAGPLTPVDDNEMDDSWQRTP